MGKKNSKNKNPKNNNNCFSTDNNQYIIGELIKKEEYISDNSEPLPLSKISITEQMKKSVCIIDNEKEKGTGFICLIPYPNEFSLFRVLITCNHILNDIKIGNKIKLIFDGKEKIIIINEFRKIYANEEYDINIIELKENEFDLNDYLLIDDLMYKENELNRIYKNKEIYIIHYLKGKELNYFVDRIINIDNSQIQYCCDISDDLSGAPILKLENYQVIGIHTGNNRNKKCNIGEIIKLAIDDFSKENKPVKNNEYKIMNNKDKKLEKKKINDKLLNKNGINYIIAEIEIKEEDLYKDIRIINSFEHCRNGIILEREKGEKEEDFENEREIKQNCEIIINNEKIPFSFFYKFNKKGKYIILYLFKNKLSKINNLFHSCSSITNINLYKFNAENVTNMFDLFYNCSTLKNINFSNFNTQNAINMGSIFRGCSSLTSINLSSFNTKNVTDMNYMFYGCSSLKNLNLSNFNTQNVIDISYMFCECRALTNINLSNFNTNKVTNMGSMFSRCSSLTGIDLSNFNTKKVANMSSLFWGCRSLININLSNFKIKNTTYKGSMFFGCNSLIKKYTFI